MNLFTEKYEKLNFIIVIIVKLYFEIITSVICLHSIQYICMFNDHYYRCECIVIIFFNEIIQSLLVIYSLHWDHYLTLLTTYHFVF